MGDDEHVDLGGSTFGREASARTSAPGAGIDPDASPAERPDEPAGVAELRRHDEPRAGGAEELERPCAGGARGGLAGRRSGAAEHADLGGQTRVERVTGTGAGRPRDASAAPCVST